MTIGALNPELSAARTLSRAQAVILTAVVVSLAVLLATSPEGTVVWLLACSCGVNLVAAAHYLVVAAVSVFRPAGPISSAPLEDSQLPTYTILAPLREEAAVAAELVRAFEALDYPHHLLEVKLIVEVDDRETLDALGSIELRPHFELLLLPRGKPRTKPRACNFGLAHTRGELVVVYDAEDLPEPQQLRKAAAALAAAPPEVACLQANLHVWNADRNWLAHYGANEFAHLCQVFRAGLERMDAPILLCGTSVHLRTAVLRELSGWDEFNVAEDADLGIRLARAGYRARMLDSNTYEEANTKLWNWIRQRSRWIKGWVQTWLVHNRHPWRLWRDLGARRAAQLQLTLGLPVAQAFLAPASWSLPLLWVLALCGIHTFIPEWLLTAGFIAFVGGAVVEIAIHAIALRRAGGYAIRSVWAVPLFGLLKTIAAGKAIGQLFSRPHHWEKTVHGLEAQHPAVAWPTVVAGESSG